MAQEEVLKVSADKVKPASLQEELQMLADAANTLFADAHRVGTANMDFYAGLFEMFAEDLRKLAEVRPAVNEMQPNFQITVLKPIRVR
jgi:hypothetical protein